MRVFRVRRPAWLLGIALALSAALLNGSCQVTARPISDRNAAGDANILVFSWDRSLGTVDPNGGKLRKLIEPAPDSYLRGPVWSPDGRYIAYYQWKVSQTGAFSLPEADLLVANADGSGARMVVQHDKPGSVVQDPAWSADGQALYFTSSKLVSPDRPFDGVRLEIQRVSLGGGAPQMVVRNATSPHLSRDGQWLTYLAPAPGTLSNNLFVSRPDGSETRQLTRPGDFLQLLAPKLSPSGAQIAFAASSPRRDAPRAPATPSARNPLLDLLGARVAEADGLPMDIWTIGVDGTGLKRLTNIAEDSPYPAWSGDGKRIAFLALGGLYVVSADGADLKKISNAMSHGQLDWFSR